MKRQSYLLTAGLVFACAALLHLGRIVLGWDLVLGTIEIPTWFSGLVGLFALYMSVQAFKYSKTK